MSTGLSRILPLTRTRFLALFLFLAALVPRLPGLNRFLTSDENTNIIFAGSDVITAFLRGDFQGTYWHFYPGVTMSWLDALGMGGQYLFQWLSGAALPPFTEYVYSDILLLLVASRLPYAILTALAAPAIYLLARQLLPERVALFGALFLTFDPFYLAHSRVVHGDAPLAVFMALSTLAFLVYGTRVRETIRRQFSVPSFYLVVSAILGGLAALTKAPGQIIPVVIGGMSVLYAVWEIWRVKRAGGRLHAKRAGGTQSEQVAGARQDVGGDTQDTGRPTYRVSSIIVYWLMVIITWSIIFLVVYVLLWPAMWVDPVGVIQRMLAETFGKVDEGHLVYFWGQPTLDPGPWFYLYVIPFRMTPVTLIGAFLSLILLPFSHKTSTLINSPHANRPSPNPYPPPPIPHPLLFWLFVASFLLLGSLSPKKQDRYLLLLFPFLDLLAAVGWLGTIDLAFHSTRRWFAAIPLARIFAPILLFLHFMPVWTYYPYYLAYFNPLLGGPTRASQTTLMGWGEGMEQVAAYLNTKPNAERLYVASTPSQTLLPYFVGTGENFYTNDIAFRADYVVLYLAQMQRLAPSPEIARYFQALKPEEVITIQGVTYAKIYPGPKLILTDIPAEATPVNIGLGNVIRLAGYKISTCAITAQGREDASRGLPNPSGKSSTYCNPRLTLYWHALAPLQVDYTFSVRARAADGRLLGQRDSWPVNGLLPTSLWRQGDYVADTPTLSLSESDYAQVNYFEIVVYKADTGETLGSPITLPLNVASRSVGDNE